MTSEEILDGNKLIAEFLGINKKVYGETGTTYYIDDTPYQLVKLKYYSSWDWLMPVVEKIENVLDGDVSVIISDASCGISYSNSYSICAEAYTKIEAIWLACVNFITWYNLQTNK